MRWLEVENPEGKRIARWMRSVGVREDGAVFVPAAMGGNENEVSLCLAYDATECATYLDHYFVPVDWMAREFPDTREICETILLAVQSSIRDQA